MTFSNMYLYVYEPKQNKGSGRLRILCMFKSLVSYDLRQNIIEL